MWPRLKLRDELIERGGFFCDRGNPFIRFKGTSVKQAPTTTQTWRDLETTLANLIAPNKQGARELMEPQYFPGQRLAEVSPDAMLAAQNALGGMASGPMELYEPIYERAQQQWEQEIAPSVMERFAGMGNALSGGASSALAREGQNLMTGISAEVAPLFQEAMFQMPGLAAFEQAGRQAPLDLEQQLWAEEQGWPQVNPYWSAAQSLMGLGGPGTVENYAQPGTDWGAIGGNLGSAAILSMALKSDRRSKENFAEISNALEKVMALNGQTYNYKISPNEPRAGLIAQDVQAVLPEGVEERPNRLLYIRVESVLALLVNAVKELANEVAEIRSAAVLN